MISADKNNVRLSGTKPELLAEFSLIVKSMSENYTREELQKAFDDGFKSEEEIRDEVTEKLLSILFGEMFESGVKSEKGEKHGE